MSNTFWCMPILPLSNLRAMAGVPVHDYMRGLAHLMLIVFGKHYKVERITIVEHIMHVRSTSAAENSRILCPPPSHNMLGCRKFVAQMRNYSHTQTWRGVFLVRRKCSRVAVRACSICWLYRCACILATKKLKDACANGKLVLCSSRIVAIKRPK